MAPGCAHFPADVILGWSWRCDPSCGFPIRKLRQRSVEVGEVDDDLRQLVADMAETMVAANGAGLAAIQVGAPVRLFIVDGDVAGGAEDSPPKVFINPEIVEISDEAQTATRAACRSPTSSCRSSAACARGCGRCDLDGNIFEAEGEGLFARALQHETDHLNGQLLIDQVGPVKREIIKRKLRKDARGGARKRRRSARAGARRRASAGWASIAPC